jgi:type IV pilus assembly protein PilA
MDRRDEGFTLIELLTVMAIIAALAAIAIPVFLGQRTHAYVASLQSAVHEAATAEEAYAGDHDGAYVTVGTAETKLLSEGFRMTPGVTVTLAPTSTGTGYCLMGSTVASAKQIWFTNDGSAGGNISEVKPASC